MFKIKQLNQISKIKNFVLVANLKINDFSK